MHPVLIQLGPFEIRFYGLMYVIAILVGLKLVRGEAERKGLGLSADEAGNFVLLAVVLGIIGARLYYVAFRWDYYSRALLEIPAIWHGGLAIHGGIAGGVVGGVIFTRRKRLPFFRFADAVAPSIILGQTFGRFGNFMNGDAHGLPTDLPWGITFPPESIAGQEFPETPLHPTMLYELVLNFLIFLTLWRLRRRPHGDGFIFSLYLILYSAGRFVVSFYRADSLYLGTFRAAHVVGLILMALFAAFILSRRLWRPQA
ncbi:MAG: prolipoprotein diacylglyceryl transferase [Nitrospinota bacterium]